MKFPTESAKQLGAYKAQSEFRSSVPYPAPPALKASPIAAGEREAITRSSSEWLSVGGVKAGHTMTQQPLVVTGQGDYRREFTPLPEESKGFTPGLLDGAIMALVVVAGVVAIYAVVAIVLPMIVKAL